MTTERRSGMGTQERLAEALVDGAFLRREQLEQAVELGRKSGKKLQDVLLEQQYLTSETLATVLSFQFNVPVVELRQFHLQPEALKLIPAEVAREHVVLPLSIEGENLRVATEDPLNMDLMDKLGAISRMKIRPVLPLRGGLREMIDSSYKATTQIAQELRQAAEQEAPRVEARTILETEAVAKAPVVRAVDMVIEQAVRDRASDIHIVPRKDDLKVLYRIDGILHQAVSLPKGIHQAMLSRIKVLSSMNIAERRRPQDGGFTTQVGDREVNFRVATLETQFGEMAVIRILDKSVSVLKLSELGLQPGPLQVLQGLLRTPFGMVLVSGPTGSGKTTTLYAALNTLIGTGRNIMTIEDPVEYHFEHINQIQVNRQAEITFVTGLRAIMRLDPDIILVGEIRDAETAGVAVQAALTGHLVLSSIHANDSVAAITRLIDMGIEPFLVTSAVIGSIAQRLVRKVCPYCRTVTSVPAEEAMAYQAEMREPRSEFHLGRGCNFCSNTGFLGRIGVFEVLGLNEKTRRLITQTASAGEIKEQALKDGMMTMRHDGMVKAKDGQTVPLEIMRNVFSID
ncbi:MAG: type II/IV secretion system protein [Chloroflexi bacterium]|nr:type II/IV secretion system protein [Chloroflexota bacterium]